LEKKKLETQITNLGLEVSRMKQNEEDADRNRNLLEELQKHGLLDDAVEKLKNYH
jgi:hypothetical protein